MTETQYKSGGREAMGRVRPAGPEPVRPVGQEAVRPEPMRRVGRQAMVRVRLAGPEPMRRVRLAGGGEDGGSGGGEAGAGPVGIGHLEDQLLGVRRAEGRLGESAERHPVQVGLSLALKDEATAHLLGGDHVL